MKSKRAPWADVRFDRAGRPLDEPDISPELFEEMKAAAAEKNAKVLAAAKARFPDKTLELLLDLAETPEPDRPSQYSRIRNALITAERDYLKRGDKSHTLRKRRERFDKIRKQAGQLVKALKELDHDDYVAELLNYPPAPFRTAIRGEAEDIDVTEIVGLIQHAAEKAIAIAEQNEPGGKRADRARKRVVEQALKVFVKISRRPLGGSPTSPFAAFARRFFEVVTGAEPDSHDDGLNWHIREVVGQQKAHSA